MVGLGVTKFCWYKGKRFKKKKKLGIVKDGTRPLSLGIGGAVGEDGGVVAKESEVERRVLIAQSFAFKKAKKQILALIN